MENWNYSPSEWVPFRDKAVLEKVRKIKREDFLNHPNPNLKIRLLNDFDVWFMFMNGSNAALMWIQDYPLLTIQQLISLGFVIDAFLAQRRKAETTES